MPWNRQNEYGGPWQSFMPLLGRCSVADGWEKEQSLWTDIKVKKGMARKRIVSRIQRNTIHTYIGFTWNQMRDLLLFGYNTPSNINKRYKLLSRERNKIPKTIQKYLLKTLFQILLIYMNVFNLFWVYFSCFVFP